MKWLKGTMVVIGLIIIILMISSNAIAETKTWTTAEDWKEAEIDNLGLEPEGAEGGDDASLVIGESSPYFFVIAGYHFDTGSDTTAYDFSGNDNNGAIFGEATWVTGKVGSYALQFDGIDDYIDCGKDTSLDITGAITVAVWIYSDDYTQPWSSIAGRGAYSYELRFHGSTGCLQLRLYNGTEAPSRAITTDALTNGEWYYVVATYDKDGGSNNNKIYRNGVLDDEDTWAGGDLAKGSVFKIGLRADYPVDNYFKGVIDELKIYNKALSAAQILAEYNAHKQINFNGNETYIVTWLQLKRQS